MSQTTISLVERGHVASLSIRTLRRVFASVDATCELVPGWRAGSLDRLLDERHAALVERVVALLAAERWETGIEVSFARYGERGSIDVLGVDPGRRAALVVEVQTELTAVEETISRLDGKQRLAAEVCFERFGWRPSVIGRWLVVAESGANRRRVEAHGATFAAAFPGRGREVRRWLTAPDGPFSGLLFLPLSNRCAVRRSGGGSHRVRRAPAGAIRTRSALRL